MSWQLFFRILLQGSDVLHFGRANSRKLSPIQRQALIQEAAESHESLVVTFISTVHLGKVAGNKRARGIPPREPSIGTLHAVVFRPLRHVKHLSQNAGDNEKKST